jgi:hypothetical protein
MVAINLIRQPGSEATNVDEQDKTFARSPLFILCILFIDVHFHNGLPAPTRPD